MIGPMATAKLEVHYVPSEKKQKLEIRFKLEAKRIPQTDPFYQPRLYAQVWADLINAGLAAGERFDPAKSSAKVLNDFVPLKKLGTHEQRLVLEIAGVAPEFLRPLARALLQSRFGDSLMFSTAPNADFRVVELEIRSSLEGSSAVDAPTLRGWLDDDAIQLGAFADPLPFDFEAKTGTPWLFIAPRDKLTKKGFERLENVVNSWLHMAFVWPNGGVDPLGIQLNAQNRDTFAGFAGVGATLDYALGTASGKPFPYAPPVVEAALRNAMRALHATVPLKKVVITFPGGTANEKVAFPFPYFGHYEVSDSGSDGFYWVVRLAKAPRKKDRVEIARTLLPALTSKVYVQRESWPWRWDEERLVICADEHPKAPAVTSTARMRAKQALDKALVAMHETWPIAEVFALAGESPTGSDWDTWSRADGRKPSMKGTAVFRKGAPDPEVEALRTESLAPAAKPKRAR